VKLPARHTDDDEALREEHVQNLLTSNAEGEPVSAAEQGHDDQRNCFDWTKSRAQVEIFKYNEHVSY
jgi:hypothetical protein